MVIIIKNKKLHSRIMKKVNEYSDKGIKAYDKGNMKTGKKYEELADKLYKDNYNKMFSIK